MNSPIDLSVLRKLRRAGDTRRDGRGRYAEGPAIFHYGFRPFFLLAALHAGLAVPLWLWFYAYGAAPQGPFSSADWHVHEMLFGYLGAVIAGFILTAVPNWTGRLPLSGPPLAGLVALWLAGRFAASCVGAPVAAAIVDLAFPAVLAACVWREIVSGSNWRNAPIAAMLTLFGVANGLHHAEAAGLLEGGAATRLALGVVALMIALVGGRIVPSFTRNWLARQPGARLPASFGLPDKAALAATVAAALCWVLAPGSPVSGLLLAVAGVLLALRLARWRWLAVRREPILLVLHAGYAWLALSFLMLGGSVLAPGIVPASAALHALTAGAVGTMTLAVMTRASLGHTGREILADGWTVAIYGAVVAGAALRVAAPFLSELHLQLLGTGGALWSGAFLLFAARYGPILCRPRLVG